LGGERIISYSLALILYHINFLFVNIKRRTRHIVGGSHKMRCGTFKTSCATLTDLLVDHY